MYDFVAGRQCLRSSYLLGREKTLERFPMLKKDKLKASIVYYDGKLFALGFGKVAENSLFMSLTAKLNSYGRQ